MNTFLARTGCNSTCFLAIKQSLPCGYVQFRGGVHRLRPPLNPPLIALVIFLVTDEAASILIQSLEQHCAHVQ